MPFDITPFVELEKRLGPERFRAVVEWMCKESADELDREFIGGAVSLADEPWLVVGVSECETCPCCKGDWEVGLRCTLDGKVRITAKVRVDGRGAPCPLTRGTVLLRLEAKP